MQCGRGQGNPQQMRTRCEQRTGTFGAVRAEDKNFLPATSLVCNIHSSNLCIPFVIAGNFDEIITRSGLILFILKPKLRERKETNNSYCVKARKNESEKARSFMGVRRIFPGGARSKLCLSFANC